MPQTIVVNQIAQTINFTALATPVTYGVPAMTLSATATSTLQVTFSVVSGPANITGGTTLNITGAGSVVVAADQAGNTNYAAAPQVRQTIVVNPASQTISFNPLTTPVVYGVGPINLNAISTSGLTVAFSVTSGPGNISGGTTLNITGPGTVIVAANQAGTANYAAAPTVSQTIVVTPPPTFSISIAPSTISSTFGAPGSATVTVTPANGFNALVIFTCSGQPAGASCVFSPSAVTPTGTAPSHYHAYRTDNDQRSIAPSRSVAILRGHLDDGSGLAALWIPPPSPAPGAAPASDRHCWRWDDDRLRQRSNRNYSYNFHRYSDAMSGSSLQSSTTFSLTVH